MILQAEGQTSIFRWRTPQSAFPTTYVPLFGDFLGWMTKTRGRGFNTKSWSWQLDDDWWYPHDFGNLHMSFYLQNPPWSLRDVQGWTVVRYSPALHDPLRKNETSSLVWREIYLTQMLHGAGFISLQFRPLCKCIGKYYSMEHSEFSFLVEPMIFRVQKGVSCTLMLMFQRSDHFTV